MWRQNATSFFRFTIFMYLFVVQRQCQRKIWLMRKAVRSEHDVTQNAHFPLEFFFWCALSGFNVLIYQMLTIKIYIIFLLLHSPCAFECRVQYVLRFFVSYPLLAQSHPSQWLNVCKMYVSELCSRPTINQSIATRCHCHWCYFARKRWWRHKKERSETTTSRENWKIFVWALNGRGWKEGTSRAVERRWRKMNVKLLRWMSKRLDDSMVICWLM